jgi:hypothetical protein
MRRFSTILCCVLALSGFACAKSFVTAERTAIFPEKSAADLVRSVCYQPPNGVTGYWTPSEKDLEGVEDSLIAFLKSEKVDDRKDWATFRRQVAGVKRGENTFIFIYYFRFYREIEADLAKRKSLGYNPDSWKKKPFVVYDGGDSFFRVLYDVKKKRFVWFECNGLA